MFPLESIWIRMVRRNIISPFYHLMCLSATPKRRRGRKAQEARAAAVEPTIPITPHAGSQSPTQPLQSSIGAPILDEDNNPFVQPSSSPHSSSTSAQAQAADPPCPPQLTQLRAIAIPSSQTPRAGQHSPNRASPEVAKARRKACQSAQDVRAFFREHKGRYYCKLCEYVYYPSYLVNSYLQP